MSKCIKCTNKSVEKKNDLVDDENADFALQNYDQIDNEYVAYMTAL